MLHHYRKLRKADHAVSPVIAVILMVAITVVLAATVYVWVSGFGSQSGQPAKTISLSSADALHNAGTNVTSSVADTSKNYTVASATSGMKYSDITLTINGATAKCNDAWSAATYFPSSVATPNWRVKQGSSYLSCTNGATGPNSVVQAGDAIELYYPGASLSGQTLRILDSQANSVILTLVAG